LIIKIQNDVREKEIKRLPDRPSALPLLYFGSAFQEESNTVLCWWREREEEERLLSSRVLVLQQEKKRKTARKGTRKQGSKNSR
jgi:hypothetical protein